MQKLIEEGPKIQNFKEINIQDFHDLNKNVNFLDIKSSDFQYNNEEKINIYELK